MSHGDFHHLMRSIDALSPEQMRQLFHELETRISTEESQPCPRGQGSLGAMRDAADELNEAVERAMQLRQRAWRLLHGDDDAGRKVGQALSLTRTDGPTGPDRVSLRG